MFKLLFIKFAPVLLMLLLTLAVKCYSRILNWHPLLHVKKTAMKPESLADTLSAASQWGHPLNTSPPPPSWLKSDAVVSPSSDSSVGCWVCLCLWGEWQLYLWAITLVRALGTAGYPSAFGLLLLGPGNWPGPPRALCFCFFLCANNYRCNLSDLSVSLLDLKAQLNT